MRQEEPKPGYRSSEAILTAFTTIVVGGYGMENSDPLVNAAALLAIGFMGGMYALSRGKAKGGDQ
jgi:hypothetical protein